MIVSLIPEYDSNFLDKVGKKLADLETNVAYLSDFFLTDTERTIKPSTSGGLSNLPKHGNIVYFGVLFSDFSKSMASTKIKLNHWPYYKNYCACTKIKPLKFNLWDVL